MARNVMVLGAALCALALAAPVTAGGLADPHYQAAADPHGRAASAAAAHRLLAAMPGATGARMGESAAADAAMTRRVENATYLGYFDLFHAAFTSVGTFRGLTSLFVTSFGVRDRTSAPYMCAVPWRCAPS
jgi:hypothetical protein